MLLLYFIISPQPPYLRQCVKFIHCYTIESCLKKEYPKTLTFA